MWLMLLGLALGVLYLAGVEPVASWHWAWVLAPFGGAVLWWTFADNSGLTQRRAIEKMEQRKLERRERDMEALGLNVRRETQIKVIRDTADRARQQRRRGDLPEDAVPPPAERQEPRM
jgi:small Trp-rich protein